MRRALLVLLVLLSVAWIHPHRQLLVEPDYGRLVKRVKAESMPSDRVYMLVVTVGNYYSITCDELVSFIPLIQWKADRLDLVIRLSPYVIDWQNADVVVNAFEGSDRERVRALFAQ